MVGFLQPRFYEVNSVSVPKKFVDEYLSKAEGGSLFGVPVENLTREELLAGFVWACEYSNNQVSLPDPEFCNYPDCECPFDMGADSKCLRNKPMKKYK